MRIEIDQTSVSAWEGDQVQWTASATTVAHNLFGMGATPADLLPPAVRWIGPGGNSYIWERPPTLTRVRAAGLVHHVLFPWLTLAVDMTSGQTKAFVRNAPLTSMEDGLCILPVPGMTADGVCPFVSHVIRTHVENTLFNAYTNLQEANWKGEIPDEYRPESLRGKSTSHMITAWHLMNLLTVTALDWQFACTLQQLTETFEAPAAADVETVFARAAGVKVK